MEPKDVQTLEFNYVIKKLREYCYSQHLLEACVQHRKSYGCMCEDPDNVMVIRKCGGTETIPGPQTGQMQLEREMQHFIEQGFSHIFEGENPKCRGFFALNYSYRDEDREDSLDDDDARYRRQFPIFEVELACDFEGLIDFIKGMLKHLGFPVHLAKRGRWIESAEKLGVKDIDHTAEKKLCEDTPIFFLTHFPLEDIVENGKIKYKTTDPFWNMMRDPDDPRLALKVDVIIDHETFGCAQRSEDVDDMRKRFFLQSNGKYHKLLFSIAGDGNIEEGRKKVMDELDDYWSRPFRVRSGFGLGLFPRLICAMRRLNLFPKDLISANLE